MHGTAGAGRRTLQGYILEYILTAYSCVLPVRLIKKPIPSIGFFMFAIYYANPIKEGFLMSDFA